MENLQLVPPGTHNALVWSANLHVVVRDAPTTPTTVSRILAESAGHPIGLWRPIELAPPPLTWLHTSFESSASALLTPALLFPDRPVGGVIFSAPSAQHLIALPLYTADDIQALPVLAKTARQLYLACEEPVSDQLHYFDGTLHSVEVEHGDEVKISLPVALRLGLKRLYSLQLCSAAARV